MDDKNEKEQQIIDEAYKISKEINEICDKARKKEIDSENER